MNLKNILFPTDLSAHSNWALAYASLFAAESGATLHILHVDDLHDLSSNMTERGYVYPAPWDHSDRVQVREELSEIAPTMLGLPFKHHYLRGNPAQEIIEFAKSNGVDFIVMASHGRTGLARLVMGSVAEEVTRKAPCPVLIVKHPAVEHEPVVNIGMTVAQS